MSERLISQLAHVELISPRPDESVKWLTEVLGLEESGRDGNSVFMRAWSEELFHSFQVTEGSQPGIGHIAWRTAGPDDVEVLAARLGRAGAGEGWIEPGTGHGRAYRFRTPAGHQHEVFWEVERFSAPADLATDFPGRPQRWIPRGASPRYLDHVTVPSPDILTDAKFMVDNLGLRFTDYVVPEPGAEMVVFGTLTSHSTHELAYVPEFAPVRGRVNHIAFWCDQRVDVHRAADVLLSAGTPIEFGPGIHGVDEITYLYVREPGGVRIELNSGGRRIFQPDRETRRWHPQLGSNSIYRNIQLVESMFESFPAIDEQVAEMRATNQ
jgi:catechol 2,3-dioxygenase